MAVYVDNFPGRFGNMKMCHMISDTHSELIEMVDKIGVQRKWIQHKGTPHEHFDIALSKKKLAIENGAVDINMRVLAKMLNDRGIDIVGSDWKEGEKERYYKTLPKG